ncbi:MAG: hypothetical protein ABW048_14645 [Sphingobium sp.]
MAKGPEPELAMIGAHAAVADTTQRQRLDAGMGREIVEGDASRRRAPFNLVEIRLVGTEVVDGN